MKCKPACAGPLGRSLVDSGPESTISCGLWACMMLCGKQGGGVCSASFLWKAAGEVFNPLYFKQLKAKKRCHGNIQTWADNNPTLYNPLIIRRKEEEKHL